MISWYSLFLWVQRNKSENEINLRYSVVQTVMTYLGGCSRLKWFDNVEKGNKKMKDVPGQC